MLHDYMTQLYKSRTKKALTLWRASHFGLVCSKKKYFLEQVEGFVTSLWIVVVSQVSSTVSTCRGFQWSKGEGSSFNRAEKSIINLFFRLLQHGLSWLMYAMENAGPRSELTLLCLKEKGCADLYKCTKYWRYKIYYKTVFNLLVILACSVCVLQVVLFH